MNPTDLNLVTATNLEQLKKVNLFKIITVDQNEIYMCDSFTNEYIRPMFNFENPNFMFNQYVLGKNLDYAQIIHYEMLFESANGLNGRVVSTNVWQIYQIASVSTQISVKLRALSDCPNKTIPPRAYYAPEFSSVNA